MAILSNINGKFRVDSAGAVYFGTSAGTNGLILKSVGTGGSPVWVDPNTVGTGPWLPIAGGAITGNLTIGGTLGVTGALTGTTASFSGSISASGNSNSFGNTTIAALSASTGTFSASVTAAGNSNSFGTTTFTGGLNVGTYIRTANANTEYNHIQRTSAGYGLYVQQRGTGSIAQFSFGTGSAGSAGTNVLDVTRVGITINGAISLGGIITANAFRTFSTNPDYNLFTRDAAGNTMFIQAAQSNTNQPIAKFSYGSATVNAGTAVLQVSKDNSHFTNCDVGIGTASPDATLDVHAPSTTAPSLAMGAAAGQIFKNEDSELAFGLQNQGPYNVWMQSRFNGNVSRPLLINPLGGNIGIGTTSPDYILTTQGSGVQRLKVVATDPSQHSAGVYFLVKNGATQVGTGTIATQNNGDMDFYTGSSSEAFRMTILAGGNVGIGTTSPGEKLTIADSSTGIPVVRLSGFAAANSTAYSKLEFYNDDGSGQGPNIAASIKALTGTNSNGSGGALSFSTSNGTGVGGSEATERMRITSSGQLQLQGSTASQAKSTTQTQWAGIPGNTNASLMAQNPSGMSSASAGYHIVYGANNSSPYDAFVDVITYICGASTNVVKVSSTNLAGSPGNRSYSKTAAAVILNISGSKDYNCNVKTTFINYPH